MKNDSPLVSIVIPSYKSDWCIEDCLRSIKRQTYPRIETIVVDDGDSVREVVERYGAALFVLPKATMSEAINHGLKHAKGRYTVTVDTDMILTPNVIDECVTTCENGFDALIIPEEGFGRGFWAQCKSLEKKMYINEPSVNAARFFKREVLDKVGSYDEELVTCQDWDLHTRVRSHGFKIAHVNSLILHNEGRLTARELFRKKYTRGKLIHQYLEKNPEALKQVSPFRATYLKRWRTLASDRYFFGFILMKTIETIAGFMGHLSHGKNLGPYGK